MQSKICFFGPIWGYLRSVQCVCTQKMPELFCSIFFWHTWYSNIKEQLWFWCFSAYFEVFGAWFLKKNSTSFVVKCQTKLNHAIYITYIYNLEPRRASKQRNLLAKSAEGFRGEWRKRALPQKRKIKVSSTPACLTMTKKQIIV